MPNCTLWFKRAGCPENYNLTFLLGPSAMMHASRREEVEEEEDLDVLLEDDGRDRIIYEKLRKEFDTMMLGSPVFEEAIMTSTSFVQVVATVIASRLSCPFFSPTKLRETCLRCLEKDEKPGLDCLAVMRDPAVLSFAHCVFFSKGFQATQTHRVSAKLWTQGHKHAALALQHRSSELWGVDIHPAAKIGHSLLIDHATGVVIGETARVGNFCKILHGVTLGGTGKERGDRHPKIGHRVSLGAGATVLGNIKISDDCTIGAMSVVTKNVPKGMTVVGLNRILDPYQHRQSRHQSNAETWWAEIDEDSYDYFSVSSVGPMMFNEELEKDIVGDDDDCEHRTSGDSGGDDDR